MKPQFGRLFTNTAVYKVKTSTQSYSQISPSTETKNVTERDIRILYAWISMPGWCIIAF